MNQDLKDCIATAKIARQALVDRQMSVKEANAITAANHTIISAYALDLRERMFASEIEGRTAKSAGVLVNVEDKAIHLAA